MHDVLHGKLPKYDALDDRNLQDFFSRSGSAKIAHFQDKRYHRQTKAAYNTKSSPSQRRRKLAPLSLYNTMLSPGRGANDPTIKAAATAWGQTQQEATEKATVLVKRGDNVRIREEGTGEDGLDGRVAVVVNLDSSGLVEVAVDGQIRNYKPEQLTKTVCSGMVELTVEDFMETETRTAAETEAETEATVLLSGLRNDLRPTSSTSSTSASASSITRPRPSSARGTSPIDRPKATMTMTIGGGLETKQSWGKKRLSGKRVVGSAEKSELGE
jgi:hypothetical protein